MVTIVLLSHSKFYYGRKIVSVSVESAELIKRESVARPLVLIHAAEATQTQLAN